VTSMTVVARTVKATWQAAARAELGDRAWSLRGDGRFMRWCRSVGWFG
jgi:hypothetical protein